MSLILQIATDVEQIQSFGRLLYDQYCLKLGWHDAGKFCDSIFTDEYDTEAIFFTISDQTKLVGGFRLVKDSEKGFPHEYLLPDEIKQAVFGSRREKIWEVTRLVCGGVAKKTLTLDAVKCLYWFSLGEKVETYFMVVDMSLFLLCHKLSIPLKPIWLPQFCEGSWTVPAVLVPDDLALALKSSDRGLWEYVSNPSNLRGNWGIK